MAWLEQNSFIVNPDSRCSDISSRYLSSFSIQFLRQKIQGQAGVQNTGKAEGLLKMIGNTKSMLHASLILTVQILIYLEHFTIIAN